MQAGLPPYPNHPILETDRLILTPITEDNMDEIQAICIKGGKRIETPEAAWAFLADVQARYAAGTQLSFLAWTKDGRVPVGMVGFFRGFADGVGELGYVLHPAHEGLGYATEASLALLMFGFERIGLAKIKVHTAHINLASQAVLRRCGFKRIRETKGEQLWERGPDKKRG